MSGRGGGPELRRLGLADLDLLMSWRETVIREVFDVPGGAPLDALMAENRRYYEKHLADGSHIAVVALLDGAPVGCGAVCLYDEMPSPDNPSGRCAYLMNVYTTPGARGHGIAAATVRRLVEDARAAGAEKVYLETTDGARPMYARLGFEPMEGFLKLGDGEKVTG